MRFVNAALRVLLWLIYAVGAVIFGSVVVAGAWLVWDIASQGGWYVAASIVLGLFLIWLVATAASALVNYWQWGPSEL